MPIVIDANMMRFADRMNITSTRMVRDYGLATVDEIIEAEAERGNSKAVDHAREYYHSPTKLIEIFRLTDTENKFRLINKMKDSTRMAVIPLLEHEDLVMGLNFFTQEKLLAMLMEADIEELVRVVQEAFPLDQIVMMIPEEELAKFFLHDDLEKEVIMEQIKSLDPETMRKFIEGATGMPMENTGSENFVNNLEQMPDEMFKEFMAVIDPDVQRQLTYQITKQQPEFLCLFENEVYVNMLDKLMKPDMIKPMIMLNRDTLVNMTTELPEELMSVVAAQVDTLKFAKFLQKGHMDLIEEAWLI